MMSISAFPLSVGIAFAALSYFLLKVNGCIYICMCLEI
ncbi:hypothetical protein PFAG_02650, partial [Plasmodium falciparum Santa Lucia]